MPAPLFARARNVASKLRRRARDRVVVAVAGDPKVHREDLAARYLRGEGIEIGALNFPLRVPPGAQVRYVDRQPHHELVAEYGVLHEGSAIVAPDVVDDGETLASFADASVDFVVANHMLEHTEDPIATLHAHARVLRSGGVLFLALPDPRATAFDAPRERTTVAHLLRDHAEGPHVSRRGHYEEWARHAERVDEEDVAERARQLEADRANIHFHVFEPEGFLAMFAAAEVPLRLELVQRSGAEFVAVLRREPR